MRSVFDPAMLQALQDRLATLSPESRARWGKMNAPQMLCHIGDQLRISLGDLPAADRITPFRVPPLRMLFVHLLPWPKGMLPTLPEMRSTTPDRWEADRAAVQALLQRCAERGTAGEWPKHPAFGRLTGREWGWLIYKHTDHHLRQFGV